MVMFLEGILGCTFTDIGIKHTVNAVSLSLCEDTSIAKFVRFQFYFQNFK